MGLSRHSSPSPARALTALIFFHCRSSSALSLVSLKRRVLRPSDILIPYWNAALGKEQDMAQQPQGIHSLPEGGTHLPSQEHMLQSWPEPSKAAPGLEFPRVTLRVKTNHQAQDPQLLLRFSQGNSQFSLSCPSMAISPRALTWPALRAALTWAEPLCCSCTRCTPPACRSPSGPEAPSCYPAGRERLRAAPHLLLGALHTQPQGSISHQPQNNGLGSRSPPQEVLDFVEEEVKTE